MSAPKVSVIIPTYNRAQTVRRSIDSALEQTYRPLEVIVVDDGSTDTTREVLESYGGRIRPIFQENGGPSAARNTGAAAADGRFIAFLDSDDTWKPEKIARQVVLMLAGGESIPCCICNALIKDGDNRMTTTFHVSNVITAMREGFWMNPAPILATRFILFNQVALISRRVFEEIGGFKPEMRLLEDHDLAFRLSLLGPWGFIEDPLVEKHDETDGLSVVALLDPVVHACAWEGVLQGFLEHSTGEDPQVRRLLAAALAEVRTEVHAAEMLRDAGPLGRLVARAQLFILTKRQSLRRRLPGWPRVLAVDSLAPARADLGATAVGTGSISA